MIQVPFGVVAYDITVVVIDQWRIFMDNCSPQYLFSLKICNSINYFKSLHSFADDLNLYYMFIFSKSTHASNDHSMILTMLGAQHY